MYIAQFLLVQIPVRLQSILRLHRDRMYRQKWYCFQLCGQLVALPSSVGIPNNFGACIRYGMFGDPD